MEIKDKVDEIRELQRNIDQLLEEGLLKILRNGDDIQFSDPNCRPVGLTSLLEKKECHVLLGTFPEADAFFPAHRHVGCLEYFIVIKGSMVLDFGNGVTRVMKPKSCAAVDEGVTHSFRCLEPGTEYIIVGIPLDSSVTNLLDQAKQVRSAN